MASQDRIQGLREQIKENAAILFPNALQDFGITQGGDISTERAFEIVVTRDPGHQYQAILMSGPQSARRDAAKAMTSDTLVGALQKLLDLTGEALHKKRAEGERDAAIYD